MAKMCQASTKGSIHPCCFCFMLFLICLCLFCLDVILSLQNVATIHMVWNVKIPAVTVEMGYSAIIWTEVVHLDARLVHMESRVKGLVVTVATVIRVMTLTEVVSMDVALGCMAKHVMKVLYRYFMLDRH